MEKSRVLIMGAAGRDFHNFNVFFRENERYKVVAFTATQIPNIEGRVYPVQLAGSLYPQGIPIYPEDELSDLIGDLKTGSNRHLNSPVNNPFVDLRKELRSHSRQMKDPEGQSEKQECPSQDSSPVLQAPSQ